MNIVLVEDSELVRTQLIRLLAAESRLKIVGIAAGENEAVDLILRTRPDAVLLDLALAPGSGVSVLQRIREAGNASRVLILSNNRDKSLREACFQLGASGFFDKSAEAFQCLQRLAGWLPPLPAMEGHRLEALQSVHLLDTPEQEVFADIVGLAADIVDAPIALISLIDRDRQWFLANKGLDVRETSRSVAFCAHAIEHRELMEIQDARVDQRFFDNPLVRGDPHIVFYAGVPLVLPSGDALGTLCVIDRQPRVLTASQRRALKTLAGAALSEIDLRRQVSHLEDEIDRRHEVEANMMHLATRDPLTALPNRTALHDRLEQHVRLAMRQDSKLAVLFVDLDNFKLINDTLGHDIGDQALICTAQRLSEVLRTSDTVARLGGDEFAVVLPSLHGAEDALQVAAKIVEVLAAPKDIGGHRLHIDCSIGVALFPEHGLTGDLLLRHADLAMYEAKQSGGARPFLCNTDLDLRAQEMLSLDNDLRDAFRRDELFLHYQPQTSLTGGRLCGVEALVRWQHPHLGLIPPDRFIPVAESRGLIGELGRIVLDKAMAQLVRWDAEGVSVPRIAVNVSAAELRPGFADAVEMALRKHGIPPGRLELEITESALTSDGIETLSMLHRLRALGIRIAVDDFGVGYSSLGQLRRLPIDSLKIDRSFVEAIDSNAQDSAIVQAIVTMATALGLCTIAEGAEHEAQFRMLEKLGCDCVQGYFVARPMSAADFNKWEQLFAAAEAA